MGCLQSVVTNLSHIDANKVQLVRSLGGEQLVQFYNWSSFLQQFCKTIPAITSFHVSHVSKEDPGKVFLQKSTTAPKEECNILRQPIPSSEFPTEIMPKSLDVQRQWYLYDRIQPFCTSNLSADLSCPKPTVPRPSIGENSHKSLKRPPSNSEQSHSKRS